MPDLLIVLLVVLALVVLNGLFVAAEFAIIGTPRAAIAAQAESGSRRARQVAAVLDDPTRLDRYVATAQLGITFASLGLGMYGEHTLAVFFEHWLTAAGFAGLGAQVTAHGLAVVLAIIAITYLHIVFGEMIPKALALSHAVRVALWVTPVMLMIGLVLSPLVRTLNLTGNYLLRLVGTLVGRELDHPAVDSVSGLILSELGRPPRLGDQVQWNGLNFAVVNLHGHGVLQAVVSLIGDGSQLIGGPDRR
ncbi:CNNM domain-containing protein [Sedimenticola hydrogenitrophicus]|uniref:CNNM domain-containing protein n=1 Tax=Sedimenticola hydrogenitrophicus TaxID=2967975 RepID=UPI0023B07EF0|nr:CNNM domain-containing protein [Sedimenticola hydrogenitrophicus]